MAIGEGRKVSQGRSLIGLPHFFISLRFEEIGKLPTDTKSMAMANVSEDTNVSVEAYTPNQIKSVLLSDGKWYTTTDCKLIQFAINSSSSPVHPQKLYPYLSWYDKNTGKNMRVSFNQIIAFETR